MLETLTIITLSVLFLLLFRPGKTPPLDNPLEINRVGQFHAVLAPKLNLAQPLLETISAQFSQADRQAGSTPTLYYTVQDKEVRAHGQDYYLLAATLREGVLYFQATAPQSRQSDRTTLQNFVDAAMNKHLISTESLDTREPIQTTTAESRLTTAIQAAGAARGITLTPL